MEGDYISGLFDVEIIFQAELIFLHFRKKYFHLHPGKNLRFSINL
jgi:hypothetical protein